MTPVSPSTAPRAPHWPAYAAAGFVGLFCAVVLAVAAVDAVARGQAPQGDGWIALGAVGLRLVTVAAALASVRPWGRRLPGWMVLGGLWGIATAQFAYPFLELVVKLLLLLGVLPPVEGGIGNMSPTGWFNFAAVWVVFGVPAVLFALAAISYQRRTAAPTVWAWYGGAGGVAFLLLLGMLIG